MSEALLCAIDFGTQSVRALVFDLHGNLLEKSQVALDTYNTPQPGWVEHDVILFWEKMCQACQLLWQKQPLLRQRLVGVAVTTQRGTVINLDEHNAPLRPAIIWLDQRRTDVIPAIKPWWRLAFKAAGVEHTARYFQHEAEINWIAQQQPDIWRKTQKFLLLSGYLNFKLTGQFVDSTGSQVGYIPFDYKKQNWASEWDWKWQALPIARNLLPSLVPPGTPFGVISADAAQQTGLPENLPVIAAAADKACEILGAGCVSPDIGCLSFGTTATINTTNRRYVEASPFIPPYPAAVPKHYSTEVQITRGFWMVSWFKEQFGLYEQLQADQRGVSPESLFDDLVNRVPPGSMGLMLQPYWSPGIKIPGPEAKGAIIGFGDVHTRAHMYRAILEGLAYALREAKERVEKRNAVPIRRLRISGGGSQ
ncbi:MAG TPA: FGGY-family carbohydrate kinase, partial [Pseudomonadales bacterium]|nr:FGGY-family carbohydrate kinase [Pseudomonadales bacterium]